MNYYEIWSCAVRLIKKGEGFPSNLVMTSLKMYFYTAALYICILVHTKLGPFLLKPVLFYPNSNSPQKKDIVTRAAF